MKYSAFTWSVCSLHDLEERIDGQNAFTLLRGSAITSRINRKSKGDATRKWMKTEGKKYIAISVVLFLKFLWSILTVGYRETLSNISTRIDEHFFHGMFHACFSNVS